MAYSINDGKEEKSCELVSENMTMYHFMSIFWENIVYEYSRNIHRAWSFELQFKLCKDTFPLGTIISVVEFVENYTLQPWNEVQSQY